MEFLFFFDGQPEINVHVHAFVLQKVILKKEIKIWADGKGINRIYYQNN